MFNEDQQSLSESQLIDVYNALKNREGREGAYIKQ